MTQSQKERELMEKIKNINLGMAFQKRASRIQQMPKKPVKIFCGDEDRADFLIQALGQLDLNAQCEIYTTDGEFMLEVKL